MPSDRLTVPELPSREDSQLRTIVERLPDGVVIVDIGGMVRLVNPAAERLFGRTAAELIGADFGFPLVLGETTEIEVVRRGGEVCTAELRLVTVEWEGESAYLVALRDVTDRRRAEERERQLVRERAARAEAEAASHAKSEFLAVMSHELRTPLNAVLGYADLLDLGIAGPLTTEQRQQLGRISASARHLLSLINEILDLARVEAGRLAVERARRRAADAAGTALVITQPEAERRGVTVVGPRETALACYTGDENRVRQILVNLLANAVKFTRAGGQVSLDVVETAEAGPSPALRHGTHWVVFRVTDTGIGIPAEKLETIFLPFVQAHSGRTREQDGSGLGLAISRRLARLMGGDILARSEVGRGSTFELWLPGAGAPTPGAGLHAVVLPDESAVGPDGVSCGLAEVGDTLLGDVGAIVEGFVARLRSDDARPAAAASLKFPSLADHTATLLADIATVLSALEDAKGRPSPIVVDGSEVQRAIAERHGVQRARLGWSREALDREFAILTEEVTRALRARFVLDRRLDEAIAVVTRLLAQAHATSERALAVELGVLDE